MAYALLTRGLDPAQRLAVERRLAGIDEPPAAEQSAPRFGADWGEGAAAQEAQDSALAMLGIPSLELLPVAEEG